MLHLLKQGWLQDVFYICLIRFTQLIAKVTTR